MTAAPPKPPAPSAPAPSKGTTAPKLRTEPAKFEPPAIVYNAVEGFGKTTFAAHAPSPAILMARGERGYTTLASAGRVPTVPNVLLESWGETLAMVDSLIADPQGIQTLALDAMGGFERLCHEEVCRRDFSNDWSEKGFTAFHRGYEVAVSDWLQLLQRLDTLRQKQGMTLVLLSHCKVKTFKNPLGSDYDRYVSDVHEKTWAVTAKWADAVLFGNFYSVVKGTNDVMKKGKGIGGTDRVVYTERRDGFDAKNRYGMPESIDLPADPAATWSSIYQHIKH